MGWQEPEEKKAERVLTWASLIFPRMTSSTRWAALQEISLYKRLFLVCMCIQFYNLQQQQLVLLSILTFATRFCWDHFSFGSSECEYGGKKKGFSTFVSFRGSSVKTATSCPRRRLGCRVAGRRSRMRRLTPLYLLPWRSSKTPQLRMKRWDEGISLD